MVTVNKKSNIAIIISIIAFFIVVISMNFGCQNATSGKENNKRKDDYQKSVEKIITSNLDETVSAKNNTTLSPQNNSSGPVNYDLRESFIKTKSYATFTLKNYDKLPPLKVKIVLNKKINKNSFLPSYVEIYDLSKSKLIQKIDAKNKFDWGWEENIVYPWVEIDDVNFDGYPDLRFLSGWGAMGNESYATYIYNPNLHQFEFNKILTESYSVSIDPKTKQISSYFNGGYCGENWDYYKVVNGKLVLIKSEWTEMNRRNNEVNGLWCLKYTGIPRSKPVKIHHKKYDVGNLYYRETMKIIKEEPSSN